jgi:hypothetical protein
MIPQSSFLIVAPIRQGQTSALRVVLSAMNHAPGAVDRHNPLVPFQQFDRLHFARFVIVEDKTAVDLEHYGRMPVHYPDSLVFHGDCDGPASEFLASFVDQAGTGLIRIFAHCAAPCTLQELLEWMLARNQGSATHYVNWIGRTMQQIREEQRLRLFLEEELGDGTRWQNMEPCRIQVELRCLAVAAKVMPGPIPATPIAWQLKNILHAVGVPLLGIPVVLLLLLVSPFLGIGLLRLEASDPLIDLSAEPEALENLTRIEDHDVTNQFTALGTVKPGWFRQVILRSVLFVVDYTTRHIFNRGALTRVSTIHFAHWTLLDNGRRLIFTSNYDGSLDSYMDDFINKVGWGLNLVFSNGIAYPKTHLLVIGGAKREQEFKRFIRRHQLPTDVWYNAHPELTAINLKTNTLIRQGLEMSGPTHEQAAAWLRLFD